MSRSVSRLFPKTVRLRRVRVHPLGLAGALGKPDLEELDVVAYVVQGVVLARNEDQRIALAHRMALITALQGDASAADEPEHELIVGSEAHRGCCAG